MSMSADRPGVSCLGALGRVATDLDLADLFVGERTNLLGYVSWGSNDRHYRIVIGDPLCRPYGR
jgi:hypothetical protein